MVEWLKEVWFWLTHDRCYGCRELVIPKFPRRPCIYCRDCMPEFWR